MRQENVLLEMYRLDKETQCSQMGQRRVRFFVLQHDVTHNLLNRYICLIILTKYHLDDSGING